MQGKQLRKLEAELWRAADQLRANSKLTASEYAMPVLGLIFLRHAHNRFVINFNNTLVSSHTGREIFPDVAFYPYYIPNGISACAVWNQISVGTVRYQIWVDNFNITWVSSSTGRDIFPDADFYPYFIPNGIFTCAVRY
ncbi:MAG: hypothetical protein IPM42_09185 [Saprospiraceae bacterium]|nr:hypothetical protein [Saprospiraceae bacterium]